MKTEAPDRIIAVSGDKFPRATAGLVVFLVASSLLGLTVAGSSVGMPAVLLGTLTVGSLMLSPICAKRTGYRAAIGIATITALASLLTIVSSYAYGRTTPEGFATTFWGLLQIAVIKLAYDAHRKTRMHYRSGNRELRTVSARISF